MSNLQQVLLVGLGGALGAVSRLGVGLWLRAELGKGLPLATLLVNVLGCVLMGFAFEFFRDHPAGRVVGLVFVVGFLGAFTTFSAFGLETIELLKSGELRVGLLNIGLNLGLSLAAVVGGQRLGSVLG